MRIPTGLRSFAWPCFALLAARTPRAAVRTFADANQFALSCLTLDQFNVEGYRPSDFPYRADLQRGQSVPLRHVELDIVVVLRYRIVQAGSATWTVGVVGYHYELQHRDGREMYSSGTSTWKRSDMLRNSTRIPPASNPWPAGPGSMTLSLACQQKSGVIKR